MTQITLELEDDLAIKATEYARQHRTSVNALVSGYFRAVVERPQPLSPAKQRLLEIIQQSNASSGGLKITREATYASDH